MEGLGLTVNELMRIAPAKIFFLVSVLFISQLQGRPRTTRVFKGLICCDSDQI